MKIRMLRWLTLSIFFAGLIGQNGNTYGIVISSVPDVKNRGEQTDTNENVCQELEHQHLKLAKIISALEDQKKQCVALQEKKGTASSSVLKMR